MPLQLAGASRPGNEDVSTPSGRKEPLERDFGVTGLECLEEIISQNAARAPLLTTPCVDFAPQRMAQVGQFVVSALDASLS